MADVLVYTTWFLAIILVIYSISSYKLLLELSKAIICINNAVDLLTERVSDLESKYEQIAKEVGRMEIDIAFLLKKNKK